MAYPKQYKGEDPNAESRATVSKVMAPGAPAPPQMTAATGGAPRVKPSFGDGVVRDMTAQMNRPWGKFAAKPATSITNIDNPNKLWSLKDIQTNNAEVVEQVKDSLWRRYQSASQSERASAFFQGVKQNPELAAASLVRRALHNMQRSNKWITGEEVPTLDQALQDTLANNNLRKWMEWTRNGGRMPR